MLTKCEVIDKARETGIFKMKNPSQFDEAIYRFADACYAAGSAAEREMCAELCDERAAELKKDSDQYDCQESQRYQEQMWGAESCAAAIRARGEK